MRGPIELLKTSFSTFKESPTLFLGIYIIPGVVTMLLALFMEYQQNYTLNYINPTISIILATLVAWIVVLVINIYMAVAMLQAVVKNSISVLDSYKRARGFFWSYLVLSLILGIVTSVGFLLLIIPGIIFFVWFTFSYYVLLLENKTGINAMKRSKELVKGNWGAVFGRLVMLIVFSIVIGIAIGIVGAIVNTLIGGFIDGFIVDSISGLFSVLANAVLMPISLIYVYEMYRDLNSYSIETDNLEKEVVSSNPEEGDYTSALESSRV